jgi:hypothetical protein
LVFESAEQFILAIENKNRTEANVALGKLVPLVRTRIREELKINA